MALKAGIDPKPYIDFIKEGKELPLPMVLCYTQNNYYLVGGDIILSLYRALGSIPTVLQGTLNLQTRSQHEPLEEEAGQSIKDKHADIVKYFIKYAAKELGLKQLPTKITLSYNTDDAKNQHSFGHFDPSNNKIWLYVKDRNTADFLRTLAHELVHRKQAEDGRLEPGDGATGSDIENEANAQAGVLLRKFGKEHEDIYETLNEIRINNPGNYKFNIGDKVTDYNGDPGEIIHSTSNIQDEYYVRPEGMLWHNSPFTTVNFGRIENPYYLVRYSYEPVHSSDYWRPEKDLTKNIDEMKVNNPSNLIIIEVGNGDGLLVEDTYLFTDYIATPDLKERYEIVDASIEIDEDRDGKKYISINFPEPSFGGGASEADINNSYDYWEANCAIGEKVLTKYSYDYDQDYYKIYLDNITNADLLNEIHVNNPGNYEFKIGDRVKEVYGDEYTATVLDRVPNIEAALNDTKNRNAVNHIQNPEEYTDDPELANMPWYLIEFDESESIRYWPEDELAPADDINETKSSLNEYNFGLEQAFDWKYNGGKNSRYTFTTGQTKYEVVFKQHPDTEGLYERTYNPVGSIPNVKTGEGKPFPIIATVTAITLDFMKRNNDWHTITIRPISKNRYRAVIKFLDENIPKNKYNIEEIEDTINITRKLNETFSREWWSQILK
jgi:predicted  nucleic acid-binding Zn-ribbon protein